MKKFALAFNSLLVFLTTSVCAQQTALQWAHKFGSYAFEYGVSLTTDPGDNVIVVGNFSSVVDFDPDTGNVPLTSVGPDDFFMAKYDPLGNFILVNQLACTGTLKVNGVVTDLSGNIYLAGFFNQFADFYPPSGIDTITASGQFDSFFAKYDPSGNLVWFKTFSGTTNVFTRNIDVDDDGNIYLIGDFRDTADFDPGTTTAFLTSQGSSDIFFARYDSSGNFKWAHAMGKQVGDMGTSITTDINGNVFITGFFYGTVDFDPGTGVTNFVSSGASDCFIACYDTSGNFVFAKQIGGPGFDQGNDIKIDADGNIFLIGNYSQNADFNPDTSFYTPGFVGDIDIFVAKYDSTGNFIFANGIGSLGIDDGKSIHVDELKNIYVTGVLLDTADLDPSPGVAILNGAGVEDAFFASYDSLGNYIWSGQLAGAGIEKGYDIAVDLNGGILVSGGFSDTIDFNIDMGSYPLMSFANSDVYIAKYFRCTPDTFSIIETTCDSFLFANQYFDSPGTYLVPGYAATGCDSMVVIELNEVVFDTTINIVDSTFTSNANNPGITYQWIDCDNGNIPIPGATDSTYQALVNGSYAVVLSLNGCTDTSACGSLSVGISETLTANNFSVLPNPVIENFTVVLKGMDRTDIRLELFDIYGKLIKTLYHSTIHGNEFHINADTFGIQNGVYFIKLETGNQAYYKKISVL